MICIDLTKEEANWLKSTLNTLESNYNLDEFGKPIENDFSIMEDKIKKSLLKKLSNN